jgi:hypothetical protein
MAAFYMMGGLLNSMAYRYIQVEVADARWWTKATALLNFLLQLGAVVAVGVSYVIKTQVPVPS